MPAATYIRYTHNPGRGRPGIEGQERGARTIRRFVGLKWIQPTIPVADRSMRSEVRQKTARQGGPFVVRSIADLDGAQTPAVGSPDPLPHQIAASIVITAIGIGTVIAAIAVGVTVGCVGAGEAETQSERNARSPETAAVKATAVETPPTVKASSTKASGRCKGRREQANSGGCKYGYDRFTRHFFSPSMHQSFERANQHCLRKLLLFNETRALALDLINVNNGSDK
jgi:hypothetical protein